jgi:hypothetical protein
MDNEQAQALQGAIVQALQNPPQPPPGESFAQPAQMTPAMVEELKLDRAEKLRRMLNFRRMFDQRRLGYYKQYLGQRDQSLYPDKVTRRSNTFVPYALANVEQIVARVHDAFFNFWPWFDSRGRGSNDDPAAEKMGLMLDQKLKQANFTKHFEDLVRNICIYGHGAIKVDWDWEADTILTAQPLYLMDDLTNQPVPSPIDGQPIIVGYQKVQTQVKRARPKFSAIDVYDLLIDPDGCFVAHLGEKTFGELKREFQQNPNLYMAEGLQELANKLSNEKDADNIIIRMAEFWNRLDNTYTIMTFGDDREAIAYKDARMAQRAGSSYSSFRRKIYGGGPIVLWHGDNPFMHKKIPILHTSYIKLPGEVFGLGAIEVISDLNESLNKFVNMITDNWNLGINRRYAFDTTADIDHDALNTANVPGGKVGVTGDPSKVIMPLPTFTPSAGDYAILDVYKGMIEMTSGISDFYGKGVGSPTGNRTATGISSVINESNYRFKLFIRNLELDILQPLLNMCATMVQQYITDEQEVLITDAPATVPKYCKIKPEELLGDMDFDIVAANYASNKAVRQRNLLEFAQLAGNSHFLNERPALVEMAKVFEVRNMNALLKTDQQLAQEEQAQQAQQVQMMQLEAQKEAALMILQAKLQIMVNEAKPMMVKGADGGSKIVRPGGTPHLGPIGPGQGAGGGRPSKPGTHTPNKQPNGGIDSAVREFSQNMGLTAMGLDGLGDGS